MITKQSKLAFLFFSRENPFWEQALGHQPSQQEISDIAGMKQTTLSNWRKGGAIDLRTVNNCFAKLFEWLNSRAANQDPEKQGHLTARVKNFAEAFGRSDIRIYDVAIDILEMTLEQCQQIIDEVIYDKFGMLPAMCYHSLQEANEQFSRFGGNYDLWARRYLCGEWVWLKAPLRARYVLPVRGGLVIRCKLNAPVLLPDQPTITHFEYDGFLRTRNDKVFWQFEKRETLGSDFFYFITNQGQEIDGRLILSGKYLTTGQDPGRSIVQESIFLKKLTFGDIEASLKSTKRRVHKRDGHDAASLIREWMGVTAREITEACPEYNEIEKFRLLTGGSAEMTPAT